MFFKSASTRKEGWKAIATSVLTGESSFARRRDWSLARIYDEWGRTYVSTTPAETDSDDLAAFVQLHSDDIV
jgi:hypothetical protein